MSPPQDFPAPDLFTTGTVGPLGQRVFYLQAREGEVLLTLKVEKEQVGALAEYLAELLEKLGSAPAGVAPSPELAEPIVPAWAVRSLAVGYDGERKRIVIVAEELRPGAEDEEEEEDDDEEEEGEAEAPERPAAEPAEDVASARFSLDRAQAAAFVERARALVQAGRPSCPICGRPMNPAGHVCPRRNGASHD
jgi:uncharacterized repeat protein (TIGR03847 family)